MAGKRCGHASSCALYGIGGIQVDIEVAILPGLPSFEIVGLGDSAVRESRNRVHAAIRNSGFEFPPSRITACYAPAWLHKAGSAFDLPLALAILMASGQAGQPENRFFAFGELSLTGQVRDVPGAICRAAACTGEPSHPLLVPADNATEVRLVVPDSCIPVRSLVEAANVVDQIASGHRYHQTRSLFASREQLAERPLCFRPDSPDRAGQPWLIRPIAGQKKAMRALQIAAAGSHNLLLLGSPGCGKTMLAASLAGLLPPLEPEESLIVTRIYSAAGLLKAGGGLVRQRPFRSPHHSITRAALVGGGSPPMPGEISLAHHGVLFLDELTEFQPSVLDMLRQPLEEQCVRLDRLHHRMNYPADFILVGAANPCRCGEYLEPTAKCRCSDASIRRHLQRLSGPLLDRMDLTVEMSRLSAEELAKSVRDPADAAGPADCLIGDISRCRAMQKARCKRHGLPNIANSRLDHEKLAEVFEVGEQTLTFASQAASRLNLSARGYHKIIRVGRTIADLAGSGETCREHIAEALQYRMQWPE